MEIQQVLRQGISRTEICRLVSRVIFRINGRSIHLRLSLAASRSGGPLAFGAAGAAGGPTGIYLIASNPGTGLTLGGIVSAIKGAFDGSTVDEAPVPSGAKIVPSSEDLLKPGPFAKDSIPAGPSARPTAAQQRAINDLGDANGCHSCGTNTPGTKSGNWVGDHQNPTALNPPGTPQSYHPQCLNCSNAQGIEVAKKLKSEQ